MKFFNGKPLSLKALKELVPYVHQTAATWFERDPRLAHDIRKLADMMDDVSTRVEAELRRLEW